MKPRVLHFLSLLFGHTLPLGWRNYRCFRVCLCSENALPPSRTFFFILLSSSARSVTPRPGTQTLQTKLRVQSPRSSWRTGRSRRDPEAVTQLTRVQFQSNKDRRHLSSSDEDTSFFFSLSILRPNSSYFPDAPRCRQTVRGGHRNGLRFVPTINNPPSFLDFAFAFTFAFALGFTTFLGMFSALLEESSSPMQTNGCKFSLTLALDISRILPGLPSLDSSRATASPDRCTSSPSREKVKVILTAGGNNTHAQT